MDALTYILAAGGILILGVQAIRRLLLKVRDLRHEVWDEFTCQRCRAEARLLADGPEDEIWLCWTCAALYCDFPIIDYDRSEG